MERTDHPAEAFIFVIVSARTTDCAETPASGPGRMTPAWINTCCGGQGIGQKQPNEHPPVTLWSPCVSVGFTGVARHWGDAEPSPDEDHRSGRVLRAVSFPILIRDLARQVHKGLEWQAYRSAEPSVGAGVHHGQKNQQQKRQHIVWWTRNTIDQT